MWMQEQADRIAALREKWVPREEQMCLTDEGTVETRRVTASSESADNGMTYYRCGGGRRVVRKRIGGD